MTRQTTLGSLCPLTLENCRFLSMEWENKIFTKLQKDPHTGLFIPDKMGSRKVLKGAYCSNHPLKKSGWINEMKTCPTVDGQNAVPVKIPLRRGRK